jgi:alkanesulfonate monooxygenase SsuD/methylene tetrahydromethanopterin reductase-like flavin-dependent oxidoreductase (luciferase family)
VAGRLGVRFAGSYHISPASALSAARAYREAFVPSNALDRPYVAVSADVVVAPDDETARHLAAGYAHWVRSIRCGEGAIPFPEPGEAARRPWTPEDEALVHDRVASQFVGSPATVVQGLERLQQAAEADEIIVTTITHSHFDRVRSFALLAHEWGTELGQEACVDPTLRALAQDRR